MTRDELHEQAVAQLLEEHRLVADADDVLREARKLHGSSMAFHYHQQTYPARHPTKRQSSARMQFDSAPRGGDGAGHAQPLGFDASDSDDERAAAGPADAPLPKAIVLKPRPAFGSIIIRAHNPASPESTSSGFVPAAVAPHSAHPHAAAEACSSAVAAATGGDSAAAAAALTAAARTPVAACRRPGGATSPDATLEALNERLQAEAAAAIEASNRWTVAPYPTRFVFSDEAAAREAKAAQAATIGELQEQVANARAAAEAAAADAEVEALAEALWGQDRQRHAVLAPVLSSLSMVRSSGGQSGSGSECGERGRPLQSRGSGTGGATGEAPPEGIKEITLSDFPARAFSGGPASHSNTGRWQAASAAPPTSDASASAPIARPTDNCGASAAAATAAISDQLLFAGRASPAVAATASGCGAVPVVPAGASGRARRLSAPPQLQLSIPSWASGGAAADGASPGLTAAATSPKLQWPQSPLVADAGGSSTRSSHRSSGMASPVPPPVFHSNVVVPQPQPWAPASAAPTRHTSAASSAASSGGGGTSPVPALRRAAWQKSPSPKRRLECALLVTLGAAGMDAAAASQPAEGRTPSKAHVLKNQLLSLFGLTPRSAARAAANTSSKGSTGSPGASAADGGGSASDGGVTGVGLHAAAAHAWDDDSEDDEMTAAVARAGASFCVASSSRDVQGGAGACGALQMAALLRSGSSFTAATTTQQRRLAGADPTAPARRCMSTSRSIGRSSLVRNSQQPQQSPTPEGSGGASGIFASAGRRVQQQALRQSVLKRSAAAAAAAAAAVAAASPPGSPTAPLSPDAGSPTQQSGASSPKDGWPLAMGTSGGEESPLDQQPPPVEAAAAIPQHSDDLRSPKSPFASLFAGATADGEHSACFDGSHGGSGAEAGPHSAPCALAPHSSPHSYRPDLGTRTTLQRLRQPSRDPNTAAVPVRDRRPATPPPQQQVHPRPHQLPLRHRSSGAQLHGWSSNTPASCAAAPAATAMSFGGIMPPLSPAAAAAAAAAAAVIPQHHARRCSMDSGACRTHPAAAALPAPAEAAALDMLARVARLVPGGTQQAAEQVWEVRPRDLCEHEAEEARLLRVRARAAEPTALRDPPHGDHSPHMEPPARGAATACDGSASAAAGGAGGSAASTCGNAFGGGYSHVVLSRAAARGSVPHKPSCQHSSGEGAALAGFPSPFALSAANAAVATSAIGRAAGPPAPPLLPPAQTSAASSGLSSNRPTPSFPRRSVALDSSTFAAVFGDDGGAACGAPAPHTLAAAAPSSSSLLVSPLCSTAAGAVGTAGAVSGGLIPGLLANPGYPDLPLEDAEDSEDGGHSSPHLAAAAPWFMSADNAGAGGAAGASQRLQGGAAAAGAESGEFSMRRRRSSTSGYAAGASAGAEAAAGLWGLGCGAGGRSSTHTGNNGGAPASASRPPRSPGMRHAANAAAVRACPIASGRASDALSCGATSPLHLPPASSSAHYATSVLSGHLLPPPSPPGRGGGQQQGRLLHQQPLASQLQAQLQHSGKAAAGAALLPLPGQQQLQFPGRRGSVGTEATTVGGPARSGASTVSPPASAAGRPLAPTLLPMSCPCPSSEVDRMAATLACVNLPDYQHDQQQQQQQLHPTHHHAAWRLEPRNSHALLLHHSAAPPLPASSAVSASGGLRPSGHGAGYGSSASRGLSSGSGGSRRASTGGLPPRHHTGNPLYVRQAAGNLSSRMAGAMLNAAAAAAATCEEDDDNDSSLDIGYGVMALIPERAGSSSNGEASPPASPPQAVAALAPATAAALHSGKAGKELAPAAPTAQQAAAAAAAAARRHSDSHSQVEGQGFVGRLKKKALSFLRRNVD